MMSKHSQAQLVREVLGPSLHEQISELERELSLRRKTYPKLVERGELKQAEADIRTERLAAALSGLVYHRDHRDRLVAVGLAPSARTA